MPFRWCPKICKIQINKIKQNTAGAAEFGTINLY